MKRLLFLSIVFFHQMAFGQGSPSGELPVFNIEYRLMSWDGGIWDLFHPLKAPTDKPEYFTIPSYMPSPWFRRRGPLPLPIYKKGEMTELPPEIPGEAPILVPRPVATLNPGASGKYLFFLLRDRNDAGELIYRTRFIEDQTQKYDEGYLFINLSKSTLAVEMNDELVRIAPNERTHLDPEPFEDRTINMKIAENLDGTWKMANTNTIKAPKNKCLTTIILTKVGEKVWIRRFVDAPYVAPTPDPSKVN